MATEDQYGVAQRGGGRYHTSKTVTLTMAAGATTSDVVTIAPPPGSRVTAFSAYNTTAFTGAPTNINLTVGKTAGGTEYVAATDVKAAGKFVLTPATTNIADMLNWPNASSSVLGQAIGVQIAAVGGTSPAGSVTVEVFYSAPNP
jgi:hypothetical protein